MSAAAVTALLNRAGTGMQGGRRFAASENSLHQIHLGLCRVFIMFACARVACRCVQVVFVVCRLCSSMHTHVVVPLSH